MNIFGERQHSEKFIPKVIRSVLERVSVPIHSTPDKTQAGIRSYIHGRNVADAHLFLLDEKPYLNSSVKDVQSYHVVGEIEMDNLRLAETIAEILGKPLIYEMVNWHESRPGHDLKYALSGAKMKGLGWVPPKTFHQSLKQTVEWTLRNDRWLKI